MTELNHCCVDLETASQFPNAAIMAIGAVQFHPDGGIGNTFYREINIKSCVDVGLQVKQETLNWWASQNDGAQELLKNVTTSTNTITQTLKEFESWWYENKLKHFWSLGANFDEPVLKHAYGAIGYSNDDIPWDFWNTWCQRTLFNLNSGYKPKREGTHHNALDDAQYQIEWTQAIFKGDNE